MCEAGYYGNTTLNETNACKKCSSGCKTFAKNVVCLSCVKSHAIPLETGGCICEVGYYDSGKYFNSCDYPCLECSDKSTCQKCAKGYYLNFNFCIKCKTLCDECTSNICILCSKYSEGTTDCVCINGYEERKNKCVRSTFTAYLEVLTNNSVVIEFTKKIKTNLTEYSIEVEIEDVKFSYSLVKLSDDKFLVPIYFSSDVDQKPKFLLSLSKLNY